MTGKRRFTASVDAELIDAGRHAVDIGEAESFSAWVNQALHRQVVHDQRLRALDDFVTAFEAEHGEITEDEIQDATRSVRARATIVRRQPNPSNRDHRTAP